MCEALVLVLVAGIGALVACSESRDQGVRPTADAAPEDVGSISIQYTLPGGEHISFLTYTLTNGINTYTGTVNIADAATISVVIGGVAAGSGYTLTANATSDDGLVACTGQVTGITIATRSNIMVNLPLICVSTVEAGGVLVNGVSSCCATWDTIVANPAAATTTAPGNTSFLNGNASGPCGITDAGNSIVSCVWSVISGSGTVSGTSGDGQGNFLATFTCPTTSETDTLQMTCTDGPLPDGGACPAWSTTGTTQVVCN